MVSLYILQTWSQPVLHIIYMNKHQRQMLQAFIRIEDPYWFPAKRDVPWSNKHSVEVVVEDEDSPVDEHDEINAAPCSV